MILKASQCHQIGRYIDNSGSETRIDSWSADESGDVVSPSRKKRKTDLLRDTKWGNDPTLTDILFTGTPGLSIETLYAAQINNETYTFSKEAIANLTPETNTYASFLVCVCVCVYVCYLEIGCLKH